MIVKSKKYNIYTFIVSIYTLNKWLLSNSRGKLNDLTCKTCMDVNVKCLRAFHVYIEIRDYLIWTKVRMDIVNRSDLSSCGNL